MISKLENIFITWPFSPKVFYYSLPTLTTYLPTSPTYLTSPHLPTLNNRKSLFCRCRSRRIWPTLEQARLPKKFGFCQRGELHNYIIFMIKPETIHAYMTTGLRYPPQFWCVFEKEYFFIQYTNDSTLTFVYDKSVSYQKRQYNY